MSRKITIKLDDKLHDRALHLARERGVGLDELIGDLLARETAPRGIEIQGWGDDETAPDRFPLYDRLTGRWPSRRTGNPFRDS